MTETSKEVVRNNTRTSRGRILPGTRLNPSGRPKGSENRYSRDMRRVFEETFDRLGGAQWLLSFAKTHPRVFFLGLLKLLPHHVRTDAAEVIPPAFLDEIKARYVAARNT